MRQAVFCFGTPGSLIAVLERDDDSDTLLYACLLTFFSLNQALPFVVINRCSGCHVYKLPSTIGTTQTPPWNAFCAVIAEESVAGSAFQRCFRRTDYYSGLGEGHGLGSLHLTATFCAGYWRFFDGLLCSPILLCSILPFLNGCRCHCNYSEGREAYYCIDGFSW